MAGTKDDLKARRKLIEAGREDVAVQQQKLDTMIAQLGTMRKSGKKFAEMQAHAEALNNQITQSTTHFNKMGRAAGELEEGIGKAEERLDSFSSKIQEQIAKVPIIGESLSKGIAKATDVAKKLMDKWLKKTDSGMKKGFKILGGILGGLLLGGVIAMFATFMKLLGKSKELAYEFSAAMTETSRSLQLSKSEVQEIGKGVGDWIRYGSGWASAVAGIREDMGYIPDLTAKENNLIAKLATNAGLGADQIASMYRNSQKLGVSLDQYTKDQSKKIKLLNVEYGLHFSQAEIIKEIAGASDSTLAMFGKQNAELEKQVLIGKKIGLNLNQQASMAKSLLDIESSIESEMEARVLTGKELNFDKARELALSGDVSGASAEIMEQVGGINEFNKMNIIQKEALAKAAGLEVGQLQKSLEMQAGLGDQTTATGTKDLATGNADKQSGEDSRSRRWGTLLMPAFKALESIRKAIEDKLYKFFKEGKGKEVLDSINGFAKGISKWIDEGIEPEWYVSMKENYLTPIAEGFESLRKWAGDNPIKAGLAAVGTGVLAWGTKKLLGPNDGTSANKALYVRMGNGGLTTNLVDKFFRGGKKGGWRRNLLAKVKSLKRTLLKPVNAVKNSVKRGAKKSLLGRAWSWGKSKVKKAANVVKSGYKAVKKKGGQILSAINPIPKIKKSLTGGAGKWIGKATKGIGKIGKKAIKGGLVGALFNAADIASVLMSDAPPLEKAKGVIQSGAGILGGALGSIAGSIIPGAGTLLGGIAGGFIGDWIGSMPALQNAMAPPLSKLFKGEEVEDFILSDRGLIKFRKDDLVIGGTKLNESLKTGDNEKMDEMVELLKQLIKVTTVDRVLSVDGLELRNALAETELNRGMK